MWQHHLVIVGVLIAIAVPVYLLDAYLLKPMAGFLPVDLRGMLITAYGMWLTLHILISSLALHLIKAERIYAVHGSAAVASAALLGLGIYVYGEVDSYVSRSKRTDALERRQGYADAIALEKWWYVPNAEAPEQIHVIVNVAHSGRFSARVQGRSGGTSTQTTFSGEVEKQFRVEAGTRVDYTFKLTRYSDEKTEEISFAFYLFKDQTGSAPEDVIKYYVAAPQTADDGQRFYAPLPPPAPSP